MPEDAGVELDQEGVIDFVDGIEEVSAETGDCIQVPKGLPSPSLPSKAEVEHHNLTCSVQVMVSILRCRTQEKQPPFCSSGREPIGPIILCRLCICEMFRG